MAGRRPSGQGRMDAAVDHFAPMGYDKADVRKVINALLKQHDEEEAQVMQLQQQEEEEEPQVMELQQQEEQDAQHVQGQEQHHEECEALFEKQEQEENLQLQQQEEPQVVQEAFFEEQEGEILQQQQEEEGEVMQLQQQEGEEPQVMEHVQEEQQQLEEGDEDQQREAAMIGARSENEMPFMLVHEEVPCETVLAEYHDDTHVQEQEQHQEEEEEEDDEDQHVQEQQQQQREEWEEDDEVQQQEAAKMGALSENDMQCEAVSAVQQTEEEVVPMIIDPPAPEAASPHPEATRTSRTRRPCYGWISESESDSDYEEFVASRNCKYLVQEETFLKGSGSVGGM